MFFSSSNKISVDIHSGSLYKLLSASDPGAEPLTGGSSSLGTAERHSPSHLLAKLSPSRILLPGPGLKGLGHLPRTRKVVAWYWGWLTVGDHLEELPKMEQDVQGK